jgi:hypothetical protein
MRRFALLLLLVFVATSLTGDELCGTSEANDLRIRALHERPIARDRVASNAASAPALLREGAFYVQADERIAPGYNKFDLAGQSLIFTPRPAGKYGVTREASRYVEPKGEALYNFEKRTNTPWHYVPYDLENFAMVFFGDQSVRRVYLSAFNGIHLEEPEEITAHQFDRAEAAVHREPVISPLLITTRKPSRLHYPTVFVEDTIEYARFTFRSSTGDPFGYDVQVELRRGGVIVYSYKSMRAMTWGTPILSDGFTPSQMVERSLGGSSDAANDTLAGTPAALAPMVDVRLVEVVRVEESELFAVRIKVGEAIDFAKIGNETLRYRVSIANMVADLDVTGTGYSLVSFTGVRSSPNGATASIDGDTIRIYGSQTEVAPQDDYNVIVSAFVRPSTRAADAKVINVRLDTPIFRIASDLSAAVGQEYELPITEPFTLPVFDPFAVWEKLQKEYALSDYAIDGVLMYQSFYTDLIFFAGAYATGGNPQVEGIYTTSSFVGPKAPRAPTLMHMNQLGYGYNVLPENASRVMLHEFGHRWLYFVSIREGSSVSRVLNPVTAHPAGYVHTPAAFKVLSDNDASVMGGGFFTSNGDGTFKARATNNGYSWSDLYLMGLASPSETQPWYYIANSNPELPREYWPPDNVVVSGEQRNVSVDQIISVHGERNPSVGLSQKGFRAVFVLVTEPGAAPTDAEVAKLNYWRSIMERDFGVATGQRGRLTTGWVDPSKKRAR